MLRTPLFSRPGSALRSRGLLHGLRHFGAGGLFLQRRDQAGAVELGDVVGQPGLAAALFVIAVIIFAVYLAHVRVYEAERQLRRGGGIPRIA